MHASGLEIKQTGYCNLKEGAVLRDQIELVGRLKNGTVPYNKGIVT
jgi:hypothetical protein